MSTVTIVLPSVISKITGGQKRIQVSASTLGDALDQVKKLHGDAFEQRLFEPTGEPKRFLNFYVNGKNARHGGFLKTELRDGDEILIIPSVSGG